MFLFSILFNRNKLSVGKLLKASLKLYYRKLHWEGGIEIMYMIYFILSTTPNTKHLQFSSHREEIAGRLNLTEARVQVSKS